MPKPMPRTTAPTKAPTQVVTNASSSSAAAATRPEAITNTLRRPSRSDQMPPTTAVSTVHSP